MDSKFLARIFAEVPLPGALWPAVFERYEDRYSVAMAKDRAVPGYYTTFLSRLLDREDSAALCALVGTNRPYGVGHILRAGVCDDMVLGFILSAYRLGEADMFQVALMVDPWGSWGELLVDKTLYGKAKRVLVLRRAGCSIEKLGNVGQYIETEHAKRTESLRSWYSASPFSRSLIRVEGGLSGEERVSELIECTNRLAMLEGIMANQLGDATSEESLRQWLVTFSLCSSDPDVPLLGLMRSAKALVRGEQRSPVGTL